VAVLKKTFLSSAVLFLIVTVGCQLGTKTEGDGNQVSSLSSTDFRLTDEISGWTESTKDKSYLTFDYEGMFAEYDGHAKVCEGLMNDAIFQLMAGPQGRECKALIVDAISIENAVMVFDRWGDGEITTPVTIAGYDETVAIAKYDLSGITVLAHFDKFFFKLILQGYSDQPTSMNNAIGFLETYESKL
jgi:hypothetical protein